MMFTNNYVLAVKDPSNKILREIDGKVYLPFYSEYSLLLKNNNPFRTCCEVRIDGTDVVGTELVLGAFSSTNLERFLVDGDMQQGRRFKFVPLGDSKVQDPSNPENGLIEVRFWKELTKPYITVNSFFPDSGTGFYPHNFTYTSGLGGSTTAQSNFMCSAQARDCSQNVKGSFSSGQTGATVEGSISHQNFSTVYFEGKDGPPTILRLQLMGRNEPITVEHSKRIYCGECGKSNPYNNKFCGRCGNRLSKFVD